MKWLVGLSTGRGKAGKAAMSLIVEERKEWSEQEVER